MIKLVPLHKPRSILSNFLLSILCWVVNMHLSMLEIVLAVLLRFVRMIDSLLKRKSAYIIFWLTKFDYCKYNSLIVIIF